MFSNSKLKSETDLNDAYFRVYFSSIYSFCFFFIVKKKKKTINKNTSARQIMYRSFFRIDLKQKQEQKFN